ncbi:alcohol dehydrogenase catalytic domain-containing protein [Actinomadura sp. CNU-125]|uniref:alcohol dehydrogenase catalytic domain-containing protein n=1 Tax=Actinomadura sp. CNU-125 TaxID=1904961 RepID=UPI0009FB165B|nr:alcohol dehydrogenase catalytic domain-containing protein [Actinomadura sp. CNU-125]
MDAAYITGPGPADAIRFGPLPAPAVGPTDVLVRVHAVAADPVDALVRSGAHRTAMPVPFVIGRDLVGEVVRAGPGTGFAAGRRVWCDSLGHHGRQGLLRRVRRRGRRRRPAAADDAVAAARRGPAAPRRHGRGAPAAGVGRRAGPPPPDAVTGAVRRRGNGR